MLELYRRIKSRRKELGISQDELAQRLGYKSRSSVQKIEQGKTDMSQSKVKSFAEALETTPEYLMGWMPTKEELKLVTCYRNLSDERKRLVMGMVEQFCFDNSDILTTVTL